MATWTASAILRPAGKSISRDSGSIRGGNTNRRTTTIRCAGLSDLIGGDLLRSDLGQWLEDVERHKALAVYTPHEGGYEGRYLTRLRYQDYHFLDLSARGPPRLYPHQDPPRLPSAPWKATNCKMVFST